MKGCCYCAVAKSCLSLCNPMDCSMPDFPVLHCLSEFAQTHVHCVNDAIQLSHPVTPSSCSHSFQHHGLFQWVGSLYQVAKYWSFSFSISPSSEYSGLISFRTDWFDLLAVQGCSLQHHNLKVSILQRSTFFMVQLSHQYMTTGKSIALPIWTVVSKVMSLLFNKLSRFAIAFFSKEQASFKFMAAVSIHSDFEVQENKVCHCFHFSPIRLPWSDGTACHDLSFLNVEF